MFEFILTFIVFVIVFYVGNYWLSVISFAILLLIISTGLYGMFTGAPYLPSNQQSIMDILRIGDFKKDDRVVELGCGDARIIRRLWEKGIRDVKGFEFSVPIYFLALWKRFRAKTNEKISFSNFWKQDYQEFDALICYLQDKAMNKFKQKIWPQLKDGTKVIANHYPISGIKEVEKLGDVYLYIK